MSRQRLVLTIETAVRFVVFVMVIPLVLTIYWMTSSLWCRVRGSHVFSERPRVRVAALGGAGLEPVQRCSYCGAVRLLRQGQKLLGQIRRQPKMFAGEPVLKLVRAKQMFHLSYKE